MDTEQQYLAEGRRMLAVLGIDPVYIVSTRADYQPFTEAERRFFNTGRHAIAFTSPTLDIMFRKGALQYEWRGRGFAVALVKSPLLMTDREVLGVLIHEASHWVADCDKPERDSDDYEAALLAGWHGMTSESEHHNHRWLRALVHLWSRAATMGFEVGIGDCLPSLEAYGYKPSDLLPLLNEASRLTHAPIEAILAMRMPGTAKRSSRKPTAKRERPARRARPVKTRKSAAAQTTWRPWSPSAVSPHVTTTPPIVTRRSFRRHCDTYTGLDEAVAVSRMRGAPMFLMPHVLGLSDVMTRPLATNVPGRQ